MGDHVIGPPCTKKACVGEFGEILRCTLCHEVPRNPTMCEWMCEECNAVSSTPHFKLGFMNLAKRAYTHHADKHSAIKGLHRVSGVRETLVQKCDAHKALIRTVGVDDRPLASRHAACLIAASQSAAVVLEDSSKVIQVRSYNERDCGLACFVAIGIGGSRAKRKK